MNDDRSAMRQIRASLRDRRNRNSPDARAFRLQQAEKLLIESGFIKHVRSDGTVFFTYSYTYGTKVPHEH